MGAVTQKNALRGAIVVIGSALLFISFFFITKRDDAHLTRHPFCVSAHIKVVFQSMYINVFMYLYSL